MVSTVELYFAKTGIYSSYSTELQLNDSNTIQMFLLVCSVLYTWGIIPKIDCNSYRPIVFCHRVIMQVYNTKGGEVCTVQPCDLDVVKLLI